ncbi:hypothetical protein GDO78_021659 [Eleutherodactylus coqui]|uniref:POU domain protein n=1 Tax=Eleutherodactylus coqui TaxID=57060 RepID=A0A8J6EH60_ELECQ|nr:hypothetical protein GDO78_021659 [Eleutherodactylus coqui]
MEQFVKEVRTKRVSLGYTQADVGFALGILNGQTFSQTTICRFESFQLSYKNMCRLKPFLHRWLEAAGKDENLEQKMHSGEAQAFVNRYQKRKQRTNLENKVKFSLETYFLRNPKPGRMEMTQIAEELKTDYDVVRVWFCNRRQKEKQYLSDKCSRVLYGVQHMVHPPMQASPLPQETTYMAPPAGTTAAVYTTAFSQKNEVSMLHAMPYGMPVGD